MSIFSIAILYTMDSVSVWKLCNYNLFHSRWNLYIKCSFTTVYEIYNKQWRKNCMKWILGILGSTMRAGKVVMNFYWNFHWIREEQSRDDSQVELSWYIWNNLASPINIYNHYHFAQTWFPWLRMKLHAVLISA